MAANKATSSKSDHEFQGFPAEGLKFLKTLGKKDKTWFDANRDTYKNTVVAPTKAFVVTLGEMIAEEFAPNIVAEPKTNGSIAPINNDLRFSPDKSPYKDHITTKFWEGDKKAGPLLYVRFNGEQVGFSTWASITPADVFRQRLDDDKSGQQFSRILEKLGNQHQIDTGEEGALKKVPKPYDPDHPRADYLRRRGFLFARWLEPTPKSISSPKFVDYCLDRLSDCADLHRWTVDNL